MFCPKCKAEYREGFSRCFDCDEPLVEALPDEASKESGDFQPCPDDEELVSLTETTDVGLLPVIKSVLEAAGIPYVIQGENALGLLPVGIFGRDVGWRGMAAIVLVPRNRREEAGKILESGIEPDEDQR